MYVSRNISCDGAPGTDACDEDGCGETRALPLVEVTCNQIHELKRNFVKTGQLQQSQVRAGDDLKLLQGMHPGLTAADFTLSPQLRAKHGEARMGDVVMYTNNRGELQVGMLCLNYAAKSVEWSAVEAWAFERSSDDNLQTWAVKSDLQTIPSSSVICALTYLMPSPGSTTCVVLVPECV